MLLKGFEFQDLKSLSEEPGNEYAASYLEQKDQVLLLEKANYSFSILGPNDRVLFCGGVVEYWQNRGEAWAIVNRRAREHFLGVHHIVRGFIENCPIRRIEAAVMLGSHNGHRWVKALGFQLEAHRVAAYLPGGQDCALYARIKWRQQ